MHLDIPEETFDGYIFDCDGTLVDSMPLHYRAWTAAFRHHRAPFEFTEEIFYEFAGVPELVIVSRLNERYGSELNGETIGAYKEELFVDSLDEIEARSEIADFARSLAGQAPMAVATGSDLSVVKPCLESTGLYHLFDAIVTPAEVARGKPAPDIFLHAADCMGVPPARCLVFEDGQAGIDGALAAGMKTVFVPRSTKEHVAG